MSGKKPSNDLNLPFKDKEKEGGERKSQLGGQWKVPLIGGPQKVPMFGDLCKVPMFGDP